MIIRYEEDVQLKLFSWRMIAPFLGFIMALPKFPLQQ